MEKVELKKFNNNLITEGKFNRSNFRIKYDINTDYYGSIIFDFIIYDTFDFNTVNYPYRAYYCRVMRNPGYEGINSYAIMLIKKFNVTNGYYDGFEYDEDIKRAIFDIPEDKYNEFNNRALKIMLRIRDKEGFDYMKDIGTLVFDYYNFAISKCNQINVKNIEKIFEENQEDLEFEVVG